MDRTSKHTAKGLVVKETKLGEADRIITILTAGGLATAVAKGSMRPKNKLFSASGLFSYSEFVFFEGKGMLQVDEAAPIELFFGLRQDVLRVAVAAYIAELIRLLSPVGEESGQILRLALNCFHQMAKGKMPPLLVKAVFELRALSESGFMPSLLACGECGEYSARFFYFSPQTGGLFCGNCAAGKGLEANLNTAALAALRHIVLTEEDKIFGFTLGQHSQALLQQAAEAYALHHLDFVPKSLEFLKGLL